MNKYTIDEIIKEAEKCFNCKNGPCSSSCPLSNDIPAIISYMKNNDLENAYKKLCETSYLPSICSRVCPYEALCQKKCIRGIKSTPVNIPLIEQFIADWGIENNIDIFSEFKETKKSPIKIAIIGGGPAGLSCSASLTKMGYNVTIFEATNELGGILDYGIPEYRLPKNIVKQSIQKLLDLGINVKKNTLLGKDYTIKTLFDEGYKAIFLGIGRSLCSNLNIQDNNLQGVYDSSEVLYKINKNANNVKFKNVAVIGGGNVAIDSARSAKLAGAKNVYLIYRRSREEMPARNIEIEDALNDGITFLFQSNIIKINGKTKVENIECVKTELVEREGESRKYPMDISNSNYVLNVDTVIYAIGSTVDKNLMNKMGIEVDKNGLIKIIDKFGQTSIKGVFAGGDISSNIGTVSNACWSGLQSSLGIDNYLKNF